MIVRPGRPTDVDGLVSLQTEAWPDGMAVERAKAKNRLSVIEKGIFVAEVDGQVVGAATIMRLPSYDWSRPLTWYEASDDGWCNNHDPSGPIAYGVDLSVSKRAPWGTRDAVLAKGMSWLIAEGIKYFVLGGRMPRYHRHAAEMTPEDYLWSRTKNGRFRDPEVEMYSRVPGVTVLGVIPNYFEDPDSLNNGVLLRWRNPFWGLPGRALLAHLPTTGYTLGKRIQAAGRRRPVG